MFSTLGLFAQVSCPENENCSLPNCLFRHRKTEAAVSGASSVSLTSVEATRDIPSDGETTGSRKRRKLEVATPSDIGRTTTASSDGLPGSSKEKTVAGSGGQSINHPGRGQRTASVEKAPLVSTRKPVSPPPSRRQTARASPASQDVIGTGAGSVASSNVQQRPVNNKAPVNETLNPRLLPMPPASHSFRLIIVTKIHEQLVRLNTESAKAPDDSPEGCILSDQDLITMALEEEETVAKENRLIYSNVIKNRLLRFTKMKLKEWKELILKKKSQRSDPVAEAERPKPTAPPPIETGLTSQEELVVLQRLKAPIAGLSKWGYVTTAPTEAEVEEARKGLVTAKGWEVCDRCKTRFQVFPGRREDGTLTTGGKCTYHWGKVYTPQKNPYDMSKAEKRYACCNQPVGGSAGCTKADCHVFKAGEVKRMASVLQFEKTPLNPNAPTDRAVCVDCEMCYTVYGLELVRLTATAWPGGEEILDVLVRPMGEILDLNSRFSGISPQQLADAVPYSEGAEDAAGKDSTNTASSLRIVSSPSAARELFFRHISPDTPVIGHALENDFGAARIIHPFFVDSALLFPHRHDLPYRNSLKVLMKIHLNRDIQMTSDGKLGHDSKEDARAAGDLVRWAVGNEWKKLKRDGWKIEDGELISPPRKGPKSAPLTSVGVGKKRAREGDKQDDKEDEGEVAKGG